MEEEQLEIQKREVEIIRKPPRYGLQKEYTITPGYVRKYKIRYVANIRRAVGAIRPLIPDYHETFAISPRTAYYHGIFGISL